MRQIDDGRCSIHCILPPHILRNVAKKGDQKQRERALRTLAMDSTSRTSRFMYALMEKGGSHKAIMAAARKPTMQRTIYDASDKTELPGKVVRNEGQAPVADDAVNEAYEGLGATFGFFAEVFRRNSIDDEGLHLDATVHFDHSYDNAFWNGQQMVFGDGDKTLFNRFTIALDVIAHELTHGVTGDEVGLVYLGQPGALNESISDVFGSLVKQFALKQTVSEADWRIGQGLLVDTKNCLRSMDKPGTAYSDPILGDDPQPAHMEQFVDTVEDNGGVHINSGIPNKAFYEVAKALGGYAWDKAGRIWYGTIRDKSLKSQASFEDFAQHTALTAGHLFGTKSVEQHAVIEGWNKVGVKVH
jgi:Zn-dependent metalloprotease